MRLSEYYSQALYRRDNKGNPCVWFACPVKDTNWFDIYYGIVGKNIRRTTLSTSRDGKAEVESKFNEKRKAGYKFLSELKDNTQLPVEGELLNYLNAYLPYDRTTSDGDLLPMLAKTFDNENNKVFKKVSMYYGQHKINGLRCFIKAEIEDGIFPIHRLKFISREGTVWYSLKHLEEELLEMIPEELFNNMYEYGWILDGEVYLPNYSVNDINHFVKNESCAENKALQYWCYDIAIPDMVQAQRFEILNQYLYPFLTNFTDKNKHSNNKQILNLLRLYNVGDEHTAIVLRNNFIDLGFEGLIMRNPSAEYQYGKRNLSMIKYKKSTDGKFLIIDIKPEGVKRPDIPLFICRNDINDATFECHMGGSLDIQREIFKRKQEYIGDYMYVEYGERSGVNQVPFHIKTTYIIK